MDRQQALEQLEAVRNESDLTDPLFAEALAALEDDAAARQEFDRRLQLDGRIAAAMQDVPVPAGLRNRLVAACDPEAAQVANDEVATRRKYSRRFGLIAALAAAILFGVFMFPQTPTLTFDALVASAPRSAEDIQRLQLDVEAGQSAFQIPDAPVWFERHRKANVSVSWPAKSMPFQDQTDAISEVIRGRNWVLIATPKTRVAEVPNLNASGSRVVGAYAYKAWQDEDFVYVLFAKGNERNLERVYRDVYPAATA